MDCYKILGLKGILVSIPPPLSQRRRLDPRAWKPYGLEAEPEANTSVIHKGSFKEVKNVKGLYALAKGIC